LSSALTYGLASVLLSIAGGASAATPAQAAAPSASVVVPPQLVTDPVVA
jgi:hypothetical protein